MSTEKRQVLPANVKPLAYDLFLHPDIDKATFSGTVEVDLEVLEDSTEITLNAAELEIRTAIVKQDGQTPQALSPTYDAEQERATFKLVAPLKPGRAHLTIDFTGILNDRMCGFYRSEYALPDGTKRAMATTQFEAADARRAFPCWDEPAHKARFCVSLLIPQGLTAVSNGRVISEEPVCGVPGHKLVKFEATPLMSTYLLAFIVGDLERIGARTDDSIDVGVWATPGKKAQCQFALDFMIEALRWYGKYFDMPYQLPKCDLLAIPDFAAGAMENWGAITFRENALLVDPENSTQAKRQYVADVVAHELAHQWFGNLVTMEWWNDLWLNESFATWIGTKCTDALHPEWSVWPQFVAEDVSAAMRLDGLAGSHPIEVEINRHEEIDEIFDAISYQKGGSLLRMLEGWLGGKQFRDGLRAYLRKHAYGNAVAADLWKALDESCGAVEKMMPPWLRQVGYPVVDAVSHVEDVDDRKIVHVTFRQSRFCYSSQDGPDDGSDWPIPINYAIRLADATDDYGDPLVTKRDWGKQIIWADSSQYRFWLQANVGRAGFYRVNYDAELWRRINEAVQAGHVTSTEERFGLQDDAFAMTLAGRAPAASFLELAESMKGEADYAVWLGLSGGLDKIGQLLAWDADLHGRFGLYAREIFAPLAERLGWERQPGECHTDTMLRSLALAAAGKSGDLRVRVHALKLFSRLLSGETIDPNIRAVVYRLAVQYGGAEAYEEILKLYRAADLQEEKMRLLGSLGETPHGDLLRRTLEYSLSSEVRKQDSLTCFAYAAMNPLGARLAWEFLKSRWAEIDERYKGNNSFLGRFATYGAGGLALRDDLEDARRFFDAHPAPGLTMTLRQLMEKIGINVAWLEKNRDGLARWFAARDAATK